MDEPNPHSIRSRKTVTPQKLLANRNNATKSSGPTTTRGKETVRRNALKHGLAAKKLPTVGPLCTDAQRFDAIRERERAEWKPVGAHQEAIVDAMSWEIYRGLLVRRYEAGQIQLAADRAADRYEVGAEDLFAMEVTGAVNPPVTIDCPAEVSSSLSYGAR